MKFKGIVRRLDSLGRIVIPREYRKLNKIKESDPLEIIAMDNGEILIKKVDITAELIGSGQSVVGHVADATGLCVMLSDQDRFLTGTGTYKNSLIDSPVSNKVHNMIEMRKCFLGAGSEVGTDVPYICLCPVYEEDCFGALFLISQVPISDSDEKLLKTSAKILGTVMQKY